MEDVPAIETAGTMDVPSAAHAPRRPFARLFQRERRHSDAALDALVASLNEITAVVSSKLSVEGVLQTVVDETKTVVGCAKAVLCLLEDEDVTDPQGLRASVVRGSRGEYPEEWWLPELRGLAAEADQAATFVREYAEQDAVLVAVPVKLKEHTIGILAAMNPRATPFTPERLMLLAILGAFAGAAIENARLVSEAQYSLLASERDRIAKEMHDGLAQTLFSASLALEVCKKRVGEDPEGVAQQLDETQRLLSESVAELRRYIYDLRPASLDRLGLVGAIESVVDEASGGGRLRTRLRLEGAERRLTPSIEACLYRVAQEAVQNAVKHARASAVTVSLRYADDAVDLAVIDDGRGFDVNGAVSKSERGVSLGMQSIRDRVAAQGGRLRIESAGDRGTHLWVRIPC